MIGPAFLAGTAIAVLTGLVGYFVVLRGQVFAGDALSHVAATGALAALAAGIDLRFGLFAASIAVAVALGVLGRLGAADDVVIGITFSWVLGLGAFFLQLYTSAHATRNSNAGITVLFGSILGISSRSAVVAAAVAAGLVAALLVIARPLLFASVDADVARAKGVPVRLIGPLFLGIVGATAAEATQAVGALLLLGLLAAPAAAAVRLTDRPWLALAASVGFAVSSVWIGLGAAYGLPRVPPSFAILAAATILYAASATWRARDSGRRSPTYG